MIKRNDITEGDMVAFVREAIEVYCDMEGDEDVNCLSFEEGGVLTYNKGLLVQVEGVEFQLTVVKSS